MDSPCGRSLGAGPEQAARGRRIGTDGQARRALLPPTWASHARGQGAACSCRVQVPHTISQKQAEILMVFWKRAANLRARSVSAVAWTPFWATLRKLWQRPAGQANPCLLLARRAGRQAVLRNLAIGYLADGGTLDWQKLAVKELQSVCPDENGNLTALGCEACSSGAGRITDYRFPCGLACSMVLALPLWRPPWKPMVKRPWTLGSHVIMASARGPWTFARSWQSGPGHKQRAPRRVPSPAKWAKGVQVALPSSAKETGSGGGSGSEVLLGKQWPTVCVSIR